MVYLIMTNTIAKKSMMLRHLALLLLKIGKQTTLMPMFFKPLWLYEHRLTRILRHCLQEDAVQLQQRNIKR